MFATVLLTADAEGNVIEDIETTVSQDGHRNISFVNEDDELVTLERVGTGVARRRTLRPLLGDDIGLSDSAGASRLV